MSSLSFASLLLPIPLSVSVIVKVKVLGRILLLYWNKNLIYPDYHEQNLSGLTLTEVLDLDDCDPK